jgi:hypothetical protein
VIAMKNIRQSRVEDYAKMKGPKGAGRTEKNLDYWSDRASKNSKVAPRASDGQMKLPSTKVNVRDSSMKPYVSRDTRAMAKADQNHDLEAAYMRNVRRS